MKNKTGIYKITNIINGKVYVGQSVDTEARISHHKRVLNSGKHRNNYLQKSYNSNGKESFVFEVLEICDRERLSELEGFWMEHYQSYERSRGYNIELPPNEGDNNYLMSEETKKKIGKANQRFSDEELLAYLQEFYYMEGRVPTTNELGVSEKGGYPRYQDYFRRFGSMKDILIKADLYYLVDDNYRYDKMTKSEVLENVSNFIRSNGRRPLTNELMEGNVVCPYYVISRHFDSVNDLWIAVGMSKHISVEIEKIQSIEDLKKFFAVHGYIDGRMIDSSPICRTRDYYKRHFGSLRKAFELAGIDYVKNSGKKNKNIKLKQTS